MKMALPMLTQTELVDAISDETGYTKSEIRVTLAALHDIVNYSLGNCERVKIAGVIIEPALRKATKKRLGRNPATGEEIEVAAKPASVRVKLTATKPLKDAAPTVQRLRKRIAA
jgi:nucleoid DNA-binding protein